MGIRFERARHDDLTWADWYADAWDAYIQVLLTAGIRHVPVWRGEGAALPFDQLDINNPEHCFEAALRVREFIGRSLALTAGFENRRDLLRPC
jgi:hypothetical protein